MSRKMYLAVCLVYKLRKRQAQVKVDTGFTCPRISNQLAYARMVLNREESKWFQTL
jgi:hypothetical protein